jgi:hypothetical protein
MSIFDDLELRAHQERHVEAQDMANVYAREMAQAAADDRHPTAHSLTFWRKYTARELDAKRAHYNRLAVIEDEHN